MLTLVNILIIFFIFLILYEIFLGSSFVKMKLPLIEGLENRYKPYDTDNSANALILAQQNAGNILYLKEKVDSIQEINKQVQDLSGNVILLQKQLNSLMQIQQDYANKLTGGKTPIISGAV